MTKMAMALSATASLRRLGFGLPHQQRFQNKAKVICAAVVNTNFVQLANITSAGGKPRKRPYKSFDYRKRVFTQLHQMSMYDRTLRRMDENSRVIVIDGPMASGKHEFARKLARELDFKFVPQPNVDDLFKVGTEGLTYKDLDELLEPQYRIYDLKSFYTDKNPKAADGGRAGQVQFDFFTARLYTYNDALLHLLSTGQGVVCVRSPWSDQVFGKALYDNGYLSRAGYLWYTEEIVKNHVIDFPRPHLVIYLDADVEETKKNIKRRNNELEVENKILTDSYLLSIENEYKDVVLPALEEHSELLVYPAIPDITEHEVSLMVEDIEALGPMEHSGISDDHHLGDWSHMKDEELAYKRREYQHLRLANKIRTHEKPFHVPEMLRDEYFLQERNTLYHNQSGYRYDTSNDPDIYPWWKIALGITNKPKERRHFWLPA